MSRSARERVSLSRPDASGPKRMAVLGGGVASSISVTASRRSRPGIRRVRCRAVAAKTR